jgi:hypothetical protein
MLLSNWSFSTWPIDLGKFMSMKDIPRISFNYFHVANTYLTYKKSSHPVVIPMTMLYGMAKGN